MTDLTVKQVQGWIESSLLEAYVCDDCDGIHLPLWENKEGVLEARCFIEPDRCSLLIEIAVRPSAVLPLQGAVHFMNYDFSLLKVMISMTDEDVPRLLLTHALPSKHLTEDLFKEWLQQLLFEMDAVHQQLADMDVFIFEDDLFTDFEDHLH